MGLEIRHISELLNLVSLGAGLEIEAGTRPTADLVALAEAANASGATLILRGAGLRYTGDLLKIAAAGKGRVIFSS